MGRRFSSHGHLISRTSEIRQTLHSRHNSSSLFHGAFALGTGISTGASPSSSAPQAAVYLSASPNDQLGNDCAACFTEPPAFHAASEDAPLPFGRPPQAASIARFAERTVSTDDLSAPVSFRRSPRTFCRSLPLRSSLSTDSFAADRFNESCKIDASVVS